MSSSFPSKLLDRDPTELNVQSSSVPQSSGPHSILDVGLHKEKQTDLTEIEMNSVKISENPHSSQVYQNQNDSPVTHQQDEPVSGDDVLSAPNKRPPPLEVSIT